MSLASIVVAILSPKGSLLCHQLRAADDGHKADTRMCRCLQARPSVPLDGSLAEILEAAGAPPGSLAVLDQMQINKAILQGRCTETKLKEWGVLGPLASLLADIFNLKC